MLVIAVICAIYSIRRYFNLMMCLNLRDVEAIDQCLGPAFALKRPRTTIRVDRSGV